jgi:ribosomal protein S27AE
MANNFNAFACTSCGYAQTKTLNTTTARSGVDMRRSRRCPSCDTGFITYEVTAADYAILQALRRWRPPNGVEIHDSGRSPDPANG